MKTNYISKITKVFMATFLLLALMTSAFSTVGLNVVLSSQNPDPVSPGNFVFVNVKISNSGDTSLKDATLEIVENTVFKLASGEVESKNLGLIPAFSSGVDSDSFVIAKYKLAVSEDATLGLNTIGFNLLTPTNIYNYEFEILVQDENPIIQVNKFDIETIEAGKTTDLNIELENINTVSLKSVQVTLNLDDVDEEVLSVESGSNSKVINIVKPGETTNANFKLTISPEADAKPYLLPVTVTYEDSLGNTFTKEILGSVSVYSKPLVSLTLDSQDKYTSGKGKVTLAIANPGTSTVKGTQIEILSSVDYEVLEGSNQYVGDLNPDDFQTIQADVFISNSETATLKVKVTYLDSYNNKNEEIIELPLKLYSEEQLKNFSLATAGGTSFQFGPLIFAIIVGVIAYFFGRRRGFKKAKKLRN